MPQGCRRRRGLLGRVRKGGRFIAGHRPVNRCGRSGAESVVCPVNGHNGRYVRLRGRVLTRTGDRRSVAWTCAVTILGVIAAGFAPATAGASPGEPSDALVRIIEGPQYKFYGPSSAVVTGHSLLVLNSSFPLVVTEVNTSTGALQRVMGCSEPCRAPTTGRFEGAMVVHGSDLFILPVYDGRSILEFDASTGAFVRTIAGSRYQLKDITGAITLAGGDNLIIPSLMTSPTDPLKDLSYLTEIDASTGALVKVVRQLPYRFGNIMAMVPDGPTCTS